MGFLSGHRGRGGEELAHATIEFYADATDALDACTFAWTGSAEALRQLPLLIADEHIHYVRMHPDGVGGYLLLEKAKQAALDQMRQRVRDAKTQWDRDGTLSRLEAPPVVDRAAEEAHGGTAQITVVLERKAERLFTASTFTPKVNRPILYTVTPLVIWNHVTAQIADDPAEVETFFIDYEGMLDSYEIERLNRLNRVRDIGKVPYKLWGNLVAERTGE